LKSSDPVVKIHQHYLNISKAFGLFKKSYIGVYGPVIEILVSEFTTFELVRISITGPKPIEITKVNRPNLMKCIRKKMLWVTGSLVRLQILRHKLIFPKEMYVHLKSKCPQMTILKNSLTI
jgi:hypothetical protein